MDHPPGLPEEGGGQLEPEGGTQGVPGCAPQPGLCGGPHCDPGVCGPPQGEPGGGPHWGLLRGERPAEVTQAMRKSSSEMGKNTIVMSAHAQEGTRHGVTPRVRRDCSEALATTKPAMMATATMIRSVEVSWYWATAASTISSLRPPSGAVEVTGATTDLPRV